MKLKNKKSPKFVQDYQKKEKGSIYGNLTRKGPKKSPDLESSLDDDQILDNDQERSVLSNNLQMQNHTLTFILKNKQLLAGTSVPHPQAKPIA